MRTFFKIGLALFACWLGHGAALAETRVALVIGNGAYANKAVLPNPTNDAEDVAAALRRSNFEVILGTDLGQAQMQELAIRFARAAGRADVAMFYYSGHAMQHNGVNYLMPVDARLDDEADLKRFTRVDDILNDLQQAKNLRILVLDSCRDNPLAEGLKRAAGPTRGASIGRGLNKMEAPLGTIISFSTQAGRTADDGRGRNSPYTSAFLRHIGEPQEIGEVFRNISGDVYEVSGKAQLPELSLSIVGKFYLNGTVSVTVTPAAPAAPADPCTLAEAHWKAADSIGTTAAYEDHVARFPACAFATLAKTKIEGLKQKTALAPPAVARTGPAGKTRDFDGSWDVTVNCPDVGKTRGYSRMLSATVTDGFLRADDRETGKKNWLAIDGTIPASGKTTLSARGLTGNSDFTVGGGAAGSPYSYTIDAQFERSRGSGKRNEVRPCKVEFVKR
ncbi:caspase family protein [Bradyrhizobium sp.]|uniref:caspase family protein n=1 Tax=Bradyrhizobium sp. TaxID=376 RepID=UPI0025C26A46|nr:caspase family protein [Bradyrhizobium sp.]